MPAKRLMSIGSQRNARVDTRGACGRDPDRIRDGAVESGPSVAI